MIVSDSVGVELIQLGWCQGSLMKATSAQKIYLVLNSPEESIQERKDTSDIHTSHKGWILQQEALDENDYLIVVSQTCDIQRSPKHEPYVEVLRAYWSSERSIIHDAGKNSVRRFLVQRHVSDNGKVEGLIADATVRILLDKVSLLRCTPLQGIREDDTTMLRRFRQWLARRYDRPALSDELVLAVQKPLVKMIDKLHPTDAIHEILDGIGEILFLLRNDASPYEIDMLFIREDRIDAPFVSDEDAATLAGWVGGVLKKGRGAQLVNWQILGYEAISVHDYINAYELSLDQYSLPQEESDQLDIL